MVYSCEATSVAGFVQQLAVAYVAHGYYFYVTGRIPDRKDPARTDAKLIAQYGIDVSKFVRARRKQAGLANVQYLRFNDFFVLIANHGEQPFFEAEARQLRDIRVNPLHFMGYSISVRPERGGGKNHVSVRIQQQVYGELKARFQNAALHRSVETLSQELQELSFENYAPVRDQLRGVVRAINGQRQAAGLELVPTHGLRGKRRSVKPFGPRMDGNRIG